MSLDSGGNVEVEVVLGRFSEKDKKLFHLFIAKTTKQDKDFTRRLLGTILTVYIPTLLLIIISHMTNYFKPFFFEAVVTVNLTVMLVLATMFISVSDNLPKTSYIKMVDVWLIFNLMIPFFEVKNKA